MLGQYAASSISISPNSLITPQCLPAHLGPSPNSANNSPIDRFNTWRRRPRRRARESPAAPRTSRCRARRSRRRRPRPSWSTWRGTGRSRSCRSRRPRVRRCSRPGRTGTARRGHAGPWAGAARPAASRPPDVAGAPARFGASRGWSGARPRTPFAGLSRRSCSSPSAPDTRALGWRAMVFYSFCRCARRLVYVGWIVAHGIFGPFLRTFLRPQCHCDMRIYWINGFATYHCWTVTVSDLSSRSFQVTCALCCTCTSSMRAYSGVFLHLI